MTEAIKKPKRGKTEGHDGIYTEMITNLGMKDLKTLVKLLNKVKKDEKIPQH